MTSCSLERHQVLLDVPAVTKSLRVLRLAVVDAVVDAGLSARRAECASVVVDELAAIVVQAAPEARLEVLIGRDHGGVSISGHAAFDGSTPSVAPVAEELCDVCVGSGGWSLRSDGGSLRFEAVFLSS